MKLAKAFIAAIILAMLSACSSSGDQTPAAAISEEASAPAVREIVQFIPADAPAGFAAIMNIIAQRDMEIGAMDRAAGSLVTDWTSLGRNTCATTKEISPVTCRVRYVARVRQERPEYSSVTLRYSQRCDTSGEQEVSCPAPEAETELRAIAEDVQAFYER